MVAIALSRKGERKARKGRETSIRTKIAWHMINKLDPLADETLVVEQIEANMQQEDLPLCQTRVLTCAKVKIRVSETAADHDIDLVIIDRHHLSLAAGFFDSMREDDTFTRLDMSISDVLQSESAVCQSGDRILTLEGMLRALCIDFGKVRIHVDETNCTSSKRTCGDYGTVPGIRVKTKMQQEVPAVFPHTFSRLWRNDYSYKLDVSCCEDKSSTGERIGGGGTLGGEDEVSLVDGVLEGALEELGDDS
ncbi:hypothetical protein Tco_0986548 [Tanacetum coccineum]